MISLFIVDDDPVVRQGLRALLERERDMQVIGEARDGSAAIDLVVRLSPDVVLMDYTMPRMNGIQATERITAFGCGSRILMVSMTHDEFLVKDALAKGAIGYLSKMDTFTELAHAIRATHAGEKYLSKTIQQMVGS